MPRYFPPIRAQPSTFGFTGITPQSASGASAPLIGVTGFFTLGFSGNGPQPRIVQNYQFTDNFSKIIGKHSLKAGFEMRRYHVFNPFSANNNGDFTFGATGPFSTGNAGADFLLGFPDSYTQGSGDTIDATTQEYYSYVQDQWKVRDNFTLNYGLGWQIDTPLSDNFNNGLSINCFSPGVQSTIYPTAPAGLVFPGEAGCTSTGGVKTSYKHLGPRVGFAYSPDLGALVGRAGQTFDPGGLWDLLQPGRRRVGAAERGFASVFNFDQYPEPFIRQSFSAIIGGTGDTQSVPGFASARGEQRRLHPVRR